MFQITNQTSWNQVSMRIPGLTLLASTSRPENPRKVMGISAEKMNSGKSTKKRGRYSSIGLYELC